MTDPKLQAALADLTELMRPDTILDLRDQLAQARREGRSGTLGLELGLDHGRPGADWITPHYRVRAAR